jgi:hypothetical protein
MWLRGNGKVGSKMVNHRRVIGGDYLLGRK